MGNKEEKEENFEGKWYANPTMRNALIAGLLARKVLVSAKKEIEIVGDK